MNVWTPPFLPSVAAVPDWGGGEAGSGWGRMGHGEANHVLPPDCSLHAGKDRVCRFAGVGLVHGTESAADIH